MSTSFDEAATMVTLFVWIASGLIAGWLASAVLAGGYGVLADVVLGVVGALVGGVVFRALHVRVPFHGLGSTIFVGFVGAVLLLLIVRLLRRGSPRLP
jgi:uncharacterized membrane protein YeaQ/YmgE (transglycosylase-associated protein family)